MSHPTFAALGCTEPFLAALDRRGFTTPTPVQAACFEPGVAGRDLLVQSRTGSGKTLAFGLPLLHRLTDARHPQAIILTPTRELAQQVAQELLSLLPNLPIAQLVGGMSYGPQFKALSLGAQVIVGTPGRVMDHLERTSLDLSRISMVVLDECDEMLNMGFIEDVEKILAAVPDAPQTYLFSATLPAPIASLAKRFLDDPCRLQMGESGGATHHADIEHTPCLMADHLQVQALVNILLHDEPSAALIFTKMKQQTEDVAAALRDAGLPADYLHGDLGQGARNRIMGAFKAGKLRYLVATDVAARGIDVGGLPLVVHLGIPTQFENYIHRSGRTGRAGAKGTSLALVNFKESRILLAWARRGGLELEWRPVPSRVEIRESRSRRLADRIAPQQSPEFAELARQLLAQREPESLVAALLSLIEDESHAGFDIAEPPKREFRKRDEPRRDEPRREEPRRPLPRREARPERTPRPERPASGEREPRKPATPWQPKRREGEERPPVEARAKAFHKRPSEGGDRPARSTERPARPFQRPDFKKKKG